MISVIIPTLNAQSGLAATLTALVPATVDGIVREVIVVDGGSTDRTAAIADEAGTRFVTRSGGRGYQLLAGAHRARFPWLLFLHADTVLQAGWEREATALMEAVDSGRRPLTAAAFRFALDDAGIGPAPAGGLVRLRCALFRLPYGDQGLLMPKLLYTEIGGLRRAAAHGGRRHRAQVEARPDRRCCRRRAVTGAHALPAQRLRAPLGAQPVVPRALFSAPAERRHRPLSTGEAHGGKPITYA